MSLFLTNAKGGGASGRRRKVGDEPVSQALADPVGETGAEHLEQSRAGEHRLVGHRP